MFGPGVLKREGMHGQSKAGIGSPAGDRQPQVSAVPAWYETILLETLDKRSS